MKFPVKSESGSVLVESALTIGLFVLLLSTLVNLSILGFRAVSLQYAVSDGTRWGILGQTLDDPDYDPDDPDHRDEELNRINSINLYVQQRAKAFGIDISQNDIYVCRAADPNCTTEDAGDRNVLIAVRATKTVPLFFGALPITITGRAVAKNEAYRGGA